MFRKTAVIFHIFTLDIITLDIITLDIITLDIITLDIITFPIKLPFPIRLHFLQVTFYIKLHFQ